MIFSLICAETLKNIHHTDNFKKTLWIFFMITIMCAVYQIFFDLKSQLAFSFYREGIRLTPLRCDPNFLAILITTLIFLIKKENIIKIISFLFIFLLGSKTIIILWFIRFYKHKILWKTSLIITFFCLSIILITNIDFNEYGLTRTLIEITNGDYYFQREYMWSQFMSIFSDNPLMGGGFHISKSILGTYMHNDFLEYLVSYGLVGFMLLLLIKFYFISICSKRNKYILFLIVFLCPMLFSLNINEFYIFCINLVIINSKINGN